MRGELLRKGVHSVLAIGFALLGPLIGPLYTALLACLLLVAVVAARYVHVFQVFFHVGRVSRGEVFFALGVLLSAVLFASTPQIFIASMLILAFADPLAALIGIRWGTHGYTVHGERRTLEGSATCLLVTSIILFSSGISVLPALLFGGLLSVVEAVSFRGSDNFFLPVAAGVLFYTYVLL